MQAPDQRLFRQHLESAPYLIGVEEGRWGGDPAEIHWPAAILWVRALPKLGFPTKLYLRFDLSNYTNQAPTARPWDVESGAPLAIERWPRGGRFVGDVFRPGWRQDALYAPCDRIAIEGHPSWPQEHPADIWRSSHTVCHYLEFVHRLLNSKEYLDG